MINLVLSIIVIILILFIITANINNSNSSISLNTKYIIISVFLSIFMVLFIVKKINVISVTSIVVFSYLFYVIFTNNINDNYYDSLPVNNISKLGLGGINISNINIGK